MRDYLLPLAILFSALAALVLIHTIRNWDRPSRKIEERLDRNP